MRLLDTLFRLAIRLLFRLRVDGLERVDFSKPLILMPNHVSLLDGAVLAATLPENVCFVVNTQAARRVSRLLKGRTILTVDPLNPYSVRDMIRAIKSGTPLVVFPEGRITARLTSGRRTGPFSSLVPESWSATPSY